MNEEIKIEDGVPIPERKGRRNRYPVLYKLNVGQSIFIKNKTIKDLTGYIQYAKLKTGFAFQTRSEEDGLRIWRVK